jgi:hypothetical protein
MELKDWLGPSISGIAAVFSIGFALRARRDIRRQHRLQTFGIQRQADADIRRWGDETVSAMTDALTWTYLPHAASEPHALTMKREEILSRLSSAVDRGRWFFPNELPDVHGDWKPLAYRGFRPAVLDCVVGTFNALKDSAPTGPYDKARTTLIAQRKEFVSLIQARLDPKKRDEEFQSLLR